MSVVKWNNRTVFPSFNSMLDSLFSNTNSFYNEIEKGTSIPAVNVTEADDSFGLELAAPGKSKSDFDVQVDNGVLTISSEKEEKSETEEKNYTRKEYSFNSFSRSFTLPENVDAEGIKANYEDGVLNVTVPKKEPSKPEVKSIEVG